jgi:hypothetical protein
VPLVQSELPSDIYEGDTAWAVAVVMGDDTTSMKFRRAIDDHSLKSIPAPHSNGGRNLLLAVAKLLVM